MGDSRVTVTDDAYMLEESPTLNAGTEPTVNVKNGAAATRWMGLFRFVIPIGIQSAKITAVALECNGDLFPDQNFDYTFSRCIRAFVEDEVTWNEWSSGNSWTTAGGLGVATDIDTGLQNTGTVNLGGAAGDYDILGFKDLVVDAIDNRSRILLMHLQQTNAAALLRIATKEDILDPSQLRVSVEGGEPLLLLG